MSRGSCFPRGAHSPRAPGSLLRALRPSVTGNVGRSHVCVCRRPAHSDHLGFLPCSTALCPPHGPLGGGSLEVSPGQGLCEHCSRELALVVGFVHNLPTQIWDLLQGREMPAPHPALKLSPGVYLTVEWGVGSATPALALPCRVTQATEAQTRVRDGWRWLLQPAPLRGQQGLDLGGSGCGCPSGP